MTLCVYVCVNHVTQVTLTRDPLPIPSYLLCPAPPPPTCIPPYDPLCGASALTAAVGNLTSGVTYLAAVTSWSGVHGPSGSSTTAVFTLQALPSS